jgi:hypothetical protein
MLIILSTQEEERTVEDCGSKSAWANSSQFPISKNQPKKGWWSGSRYRPEVQTPEPPKPNNKANEILTTTLSLR